MSYRVTLRKRAIKALQRVNEPYFSQLKKAIYALADEPRPPGHIKLKGREGLRVRVADYRIIYLVDDSIQIVDVLDSGHRKDIYDK